MHLITCTPTDTLGRTPLDEGSVRRRDLCLTIHNINKRERKRERETSMFPAGFEPAIPPAEQLHIHALDRAATEIDPRDFEVNIWEY